MNIFSFFFPRIIASIDSPVNGKIKVKEFFGKNIIEVNSLQQSGPLVEKIYLKVFRNFVGLTFIRQIKKVLILGLAGGSSVRLLKKINPQVKITAIDLDPLIVKAGIKYLDLKKKDFIIIYADAFIEIHKLTQKFDLIIVDIFRGYDIPTATSDRKFLQQLKFLLSEKGMLIFNRLYFQNYKTEADRFLDKVKKIFKDVTSIRVYYNLFIKAK